MKVYSNTLTEADLRKAVPRGCQLELMSITRPRVRDFGWHARLTCYAGNRWTNSGQYGAGSERAATYDQHGEWMAPLFEIDPDARIAHWDGVHDFNQGTEGRYSKEKVPA